MKNPKKPTFDQKKAIARAGLDWRQYLVKEETDSELVIVGKDDNHIERIKLK